MAIHVIKGSNLSFHDINHITDNNGDIKLVLVYPTGSTKSIISTQALCDAVIDDDSTYIYKDR